MQDEEMKDIIDENERQKKILSDIPENSVWAEEHVPDFLQNRNYEEYQDILLLAQKIEAMQRTIENYLDGCESKGNMFFVLDMHLSRMNWLIEKMRK